MPYEFIFISGVTMQKVRSEFSADIKKYLDLTDDQCREYQSAGLFQEKQNSYYNNYYKKQKGFFGRIIGKVLIYFGGDAIQYARNYRNIVGHFRIWLGDNKDKKFILVTHSMGSILAMDYMRRTNDPRVKKVFCMANNSPLFNMQETGELPTNAKWYAFLEKNDAMSMPVGNTLHYKMEEIPVKIKNLLKGSNLASHNAFWKSKKVHELIRERL